MSRPVREFEAAIELTNSAQTTPWWMAQPGLQYIFHPTGGGAPASAPQGPASATRWCSASARR